MLFWHGGSIVQSFYYITSNSSSASASQLPMSDTITCFIIWDSYWFISYKRSYNCPQSCDIIERLSSLTINLLYLLPIASCTFRSLSLCSRGHSLLIATVALSVYSLCWVCSFLILSLCYRSFVWVADL